MQPVRCCACTGLCHAVELVALEVVVVGLIVLPLLNRLFAESFRAPIQPTDRSWSVFINCDAGCLGILSVLVRSVDSVGGAVTMV